jgi:hypothetical protein
MLDLICGKLSRNCEGNSQRDFLRVGTMGLGAVALPELLRARAAESETPAKDTSVIWIWLSGSPPASTSISMTSQTAE